MNDYQVVEGYKIMSEAELELLTAAMLSTPKPTRLELALIWRRFHHTALELYPYPEPDNPRAAFERSRFAALMVRWGYDIVHETGWQQFDDACMDAYNSSYVDEEGT